jgi:hypothetical protein
MEYTGSEPRMEYPGDAEFVCDVCERGFDSEEALEQHVHEAGLLY